MTSVRPLQLTLAIMKPHVVACPFSLLDIRRTILDNGFYIVRSVRQTMKLEQAERFYNEHKSKFFYNRLVTFMISGPSEAYLLAREDAISVWRGLMGPTKVFKCQLSHPDTIRAKHGLTDTRNATHGSDSDESVRREVGIMIPQFCFEHWKQMEEPLFRRNKVRLNREQFIHFYTQESCVTPRQ